MPAINLKDFSAGDVYKRQDFDHVSFSYKKSGKPVLDDIDLHIRAGETIGIIGGTGSRCV